MRFENYKFSQLVFELDHSSAYLRKESRECKEKYSGTKNP